ncbi:hypothetical protein GVX82_03520 [Patescibacteria group bacterium]|jgi:hypothetical protein|nr:hypothetical protein [Patescibacteria group bacterium]
MNRTDEQHPETDRTTGAVLKLLAIIGLVAILALAAWLSVQVIRLTPSAFSMVGNVNLSSFFLPAEEDAEPVAVTLSLADTEPASSSAPFDLSWDGVPEDFSGSLTLSYTCARGVALTRENGTTLPCETPTELVRDATSITLDPTVLTDEERTTTLSVAVLTREGEEVPGAGDEISLTFNAAESSAEETTDATGSERGQGDDGQRDERARETVATPPGSTAGGTGDASETDATEPPGTERSSAPAAPAPAQRESRTVFVPNPSAQENPAGAPDLGIAILATGVMQRGSGSDAPGGGGAPGGSDVPGGGGAPADARVPGGATGAETGETLVPTRTIPADERVGIRFMVQNVGDKASSDDWYFTATLPLAGDEDYSYRSPRQPALSPADKMEFFLSFDDIAEDETVEIEIELAGADDDREPRNDRDTVRVTTR